VIEFLYKEILREEREFIREFLENPWEETFGSH